MTLVTIPMLAQPLDIQALQLHWSNPCYWFEQKIDGRRLIVHVKADGSLVGHNRRGEPATKDPVLARALRTMAKSGTFTHLPAGEEFIFDGEWANDTYYIFDMIAALGNPTDRLPLTTRRAGLELMTDFIGEPATVVQVARTADEKRELVKWCIENNAEGVMVKRRTSPYVSARKPTDPPRRERRTDAWMKAKFTETVDCIILEPWREGKQSCSVTVYDETGHLVRGEGIGSVKMSPEDLEKARPGMVIEVRYLYATPETVGSPNNRLYQPVFLRFRTDKAPEECTINQLKVSRKVVRQGKGK